MPQLLRADGGGWIQVLVVLALIFFSLLGKKKRRAAPPSKEAPLDLEEILRRLGQEREEEPPAAPAEETVMRETAPPDEEGQAAEVAESWAEERDRDPREGATPASPLTSRGEHPALAPLAAARVERENRATPQRRIGEPLPQTAAPEVATPFAQEGRGFCTAWLRQKTALRRNIVVSELLAPPLALRRRSPRSRYR